MILDYFTFLLIFTFCIFIYFINKSLNQFINFDKDFHQNFTTEKFIMPIGGLYLVIFFIVFNYKYFLFEYVVIFLIFLIGLLSDIKKFNSPKKRLITQSILIVYFVWFFSIQILSTRVEFLDQIINNYYINIIFVSFCILIVVNGTNFIDGTNGNVILYYALISLVIINSGLELNYIIDKIFLIKLLIFFTFLYYLNSINKIYLGDSGSYFLGFVFAITLINIYFENQHISPYFIILLLWYPCFENLFSIVRKLIIKRTPTSADTKHLHQLLFYYLTKKLEIKNLRANNFSSILINFFNLIMFLIASNYLRETKIQILLILINTILYLSVYFYLLRFRYKR